MGSSRSSVIANARRASFPRSPRSAQVGRIHANPSRLGVVGRGQRGLSVPLRWRPAHGSLPVATLRSRFHTSSKQALPLHASETVGLGHETLSVHALVSEHFGQLPVSQRLKSQCIVMHARSNTEPSVTTLTAPLKAARVHPWRPATRVSASKAERPVVQQTPNPSFKRTRLRRSA
jgi:hypothetical protein